MVPNNEGSKALSAGSLVKAFGGIQLAPQGHLELHTQLVELIGVNILVYRLHGTELINNCKFLYPFGM